MTVEKSILNQLWIYTAALKTLLRFGLHERFPKQVDITIDNLLITSQILYAEARREQMEVANVSKC